MKCVRFSTSNDEATLKRQARKLYAVVVEEPSVMSLVWPADWFESHRQLRQFKGYLHKLCTQPKQTRMTKASWDLYCFLPDTPNENMRSILESLAGDDAKS